MREFLFKGKRLDNGEWVYGSLNFYNDINRAFIRVDPKMYSTLEVEVDMKSVGQYIGINDKKAAKMFEGDIVHVEAPRYSADGTVTWDAESASFRLVIKTNGEDDWSEFMWQQECYEVVGNIHDSGGTKA